ncbi:MAG: hypothetical protein VR74_17410 [Hyphomonas sp. BRH_c22]|uniref:glycosyltransferase family 2 protein n=1 Tax=Hyphomonas sp. BRH_c22 TaxID=1629710 RepID=UPI00061E22F0|nr:glycosyltransferase family 2 protein [Hyphomonas sp. BRH_c22]KJS35144.1 MAG: hypothetical protein VR74_17410 [Hyphomonas sp. BRH_c22]
MIGKTPRVTLALPVYNGENYIRETLNSLLNQTYGDFELIITDNESTDGTRAICETFVARDPRVQYFRNPRNLGAAPNYNRGYELARGEYLKWCAHDDLLSSNFLEECITVLDRDPNIALAFGETHSIDQHGQTIAVPPNEMTSLLDADPARRFYRSIDEAATCFPIFGLFRMSVLKRTSLHRKYYGSDRGLIAETALLGKCIRVPEALFLNREHPQRSINIDSVAVRSKWQTGTANRRAAMEHVNLLLHLYEIAGRHRDVVSPVRARAALARFAFRPFQIGRYLLDLIRYVSPSMGARLKRWVAGPRRGAQSSV